ncbi:hypothetical protein RRG08_010279 [Elysia crispata]|uniref:Uncharacterized protein n=1 Tax=Elysia crispata TaxID=231223 RepID=A0AAE0Z2M9_9GAST|nr:hypothetical protein RRG08_010279 [Elysia crispata]
MLHLPTWVQDAIDLDSSNITLYINPHDNADYVLYENEEEYFVGSDCGGDQRPFEGNSVIKHMSSYLHKMRVGKRRRKAKVAPPPPPAAEVEDALPAPPFKPAQGLNMTIISFLSYCQKTCAEEEPSLDVLTDLYRIVEPFEINDRMLEVIVATIRFIYTKTLVNTMRRHCDKHNKKFKRQLQYVLSAFCRRKEDPSYGSK